VVGLSDVVAISMGARLGHALALRRDGTVWAWGYNNAGQLGDGSTSARLAPVQVTGLNLN
jgi:alpha-tubulin suppressor-like RCC1 family protein